MGFHREAEYEEEKFSACLLCVFDIELRRRLPFAALWLNDAWEGRTSINDYLNRQKRNNYDAFWILVAIKTTVISATSYNCFNDLAQSNVINNFIYFLSVTIWIHLSSIYHVKNAFTVVWSLFFMTSSSCWDRIFLGVPFCGTTTITLLTTWFIFHTYLVMWSSFSRK